jgi:type I restriction enzyme, S subunit
MGWQVKPLGEVVTLQRGFDLPKQDRQPGSVPIVSSSGVSGTHNEARVAAPGVVTGRYGSIGQVHFIETDFWPLNTTLFVKDFKGNHPRFVAYLLQTIDFASCSDKSSVPGVNRNDLHRLRVAVPDLPEQQYIAETLGALDDKIEFNCRLNHTLESMTRAIFKSWFVDFDPVRKKKDGGVAGLPPDVAALFPASFVESGIGPIPASWRMGACGEDFAVTMGQSPPGASYNDVGEGLPFYQGRRDFGFRYPSRRVFCSAPLRIANNGDTLVSVRAPVGDVNLAAEECCIGRGLAAVRHTSGAVSYTYEMMRSLSDAFQDFESGGTVFGAIGGKAFRSLKIVIPPRPLVHAYEGAVKPMRLRLDTTSAESSCLVTARDALLPQLLSGRQIVP